MVEVVARRFLSIARIKAELFLSRMVSPRLHHSDVEVHAVS